MASGRSATTPSRSWSRGAPHRCWRTACRVAIASPSCLPKCIEECWAIFGISRASGVFVPVNSVLRAQQIRHIVEDSGARIVICSRALFETVSAALAGTRATDNPVRRSDRGRQRGRPQPVPPERSGDRRGSRRHPLYVRLHRQAEGRDAEPPQSAGGLADRHQVSRDHGARPDPVDPAVQLRLRPQSIADRRFSSAPSPSCSHFSSATKSSAPFAITPSPGSRASRPSGRS